MFPPWVNGKSECRQSMHMERLEAAVLTFPPSREDPSLISITKKNCF